MVEDEFFAGEHRPDHVFERLPRASFCCSAVPFVKRASARAFAELLAFRIGGIAAECRKSHVLDDAAVRNPSRSSKRDVPFGIAQLLVQRVAVDDVQRLAMLGSLDRSAASQITARGPSERRSGYCDCDLRIRQLQRARPDGKPANARRHAESPATSRPA